ncbi:uncharacterized protein ASPGLDRAFT_82014 [Aspergillus glaucus CBS 516.65]|uniref:Uncharacterized protein n=1 Tax=Aspergillus glaucus CBS 516.65 TaxID=1160497 RepID=A0A1L9VLM3_ASPGL|nr:hypothetical protein ASPGLDRAFT_82014 [Aspergillus glaucus CBS 516.65]OJJ84795.1 hypothetical protein ASPGLDRAFT_82014 [Aspergillus glaucus CBS 516.65]
MTSNINLDGSDNRLARWEPRYVENIIFPVMVVSCMGSKDTRILVTYYDGTNLVIHWEWLVWFQLKECRGEVIFEVGCLARQIDLSSTMSVIVTQASHYNGRQSNQTSEHATTHSSTSTKLFSTKPPRPHRLPKPPHQTPPSLLTHNGHLDPAIESFFKLLDENVSSGIPTMN